MSSMLRFGEGSFLVSLAGGSVQSWRSKDAALNRKAHSASRMGASLRRLTPDTCEEDLLHPSEKRQ
jgi:hypothetical protein